MSKAENYAWDSTLFTAHSIGFATTLSLAVGASYNMSPDHTPWGVGIPLAMTYAGFAAYRFARIIGDHEDFKERQQRMSGDILYQIMAFGVNDKQLRNRELAESLFKRIVSPAGEFQLNGSSPTDLMTSLISYYRTNIAKDSSLRPHYLIADLVESHKDEYNELRLLVSVLGFVADTTSPERLMQTLQVLDGGEYIYLGKIYGPKRKIE